MYEPVVFSYYGLMEMPVTEILERGIPAEQNVAQAYMRDLLGARADGYMQLSYLYNGGFEEQPTGSVFDWRLSPAEWIKPELDDVTVERIAAVAPR